MDEAEEYELGQEISIEFTLLSGETISVRATLDDPVTEDSVRHFADEIIRDIGVDTLRTFAYWWDGEYYVDAVRMREVAAVSVSTVSAEDDDDDWEQ
jgi:hypothetical protein